MISLYLQCNQYSRTAHQAFSLMKRERVFHSAAQQMVFLFPPSYGPSMVPYSRLPSTHASTCTSNYSQENLFALIFRRH